MFDPATAKFLEGSCSLVVASVAPGGDPHATRGWGLTTLPGDGMTARLLLAADEAAALPWLATGGAVAITASDVRTYRSIQLKGHSLGVEPATHDDRARAERFVDAFFGDVTATDRTPRRLLDRLVPSSYAACTVTIHELFDQTPGPAAGAPISSKSR